MLVSIRDEPRNGCLAAHLAAQLCSTIRSSSVRVVAYSMFASMPMYDLPHLRNVTDAGWLRIRADLLRRGVDVALLAFDRREDFAQLWH